MNLVAPLFHHARLQPDAVALIKGERSISYRALSHAIMRVAGRLAELGIAPGDRVGILLKEGVDHIAAVLAAGHLGAVALPIDWHLRGPEVGRIATALAPKLILVEPEAAGPDGFAAVPVDAAWHAAVAAADPVARSHEGWDAPFIISPTSGTTGAAKFMLMSHLQEYFSLVSLLEPVDLPRRCRYLSTSPLYFGAGRRGCLAHLLRGDTVILHPSMITADEYADVVARTGADVGFVVPTIVRQLLQLPEPRRRPIRAMAALTSGGAPLFAEEKRAALGTLTANFHERYGTAATGGIATLRPGDIPARAESVGQPHLFTDLQIVDDDDRPLPPGAAGRLRLRGASLGAGIAGPAGTASAAEGFRDGWYYPGELAALDESGFLYIRGRVSDVIMRGGAKVFPGEVEAVLQEHAGVAEAAVFGERQSDGEEAVIAYVIARGTVDAAALLLHCRRRLLPYQVPKEIHAVATLPHNAVGKVNKRALAETHRQRPPGSG